MKNKDIFYVYIVMSIFVLITLVLTYFTVLGGDNLRLNASFFGIYTLTYFAVAFTLKGIGHLQETNTNNKQYKKEHDQAKLDFETVYNNIEEEDWGLKKLKAKNILKNREEHFIITELEKGIKSTEEGIEHYKKLKERYENELHTIKEVLK